jgi:hypothetical protein
MGIKYKMRERKPIAEHHISYSLRGGIGNCLGYSARSLYDNGKEFIPGVHPGDDIVTSVSTTNTHNNFHSLVTEIVDRMPHPVDSYEVWAVSPEPINNEALSQLRTFPKRLSAKVTVNNGQVTGQGTLSLFDLSLIGDLIYRMSAKKWAESSTSDTV